MARTKNTVTEKARAEALRLEMLTTFARLDADKRLDALGMLRRLVLQQRAAGTSRA